MNIAEIAKLAGVSKSAVSRYFNNGYISDEKKKIIEKVVEETGYRPSIQAQTLRTNKTKLIGVIIPKISSESIGKVVEGILSVLNEHGYQILLADTQNNPEKEIEYLKTFKSRQVDGIIVLGTVFTSKHKKLLKEIKIPLVIIGQNLSGYHCVFHNDYNASFDITKLFIDKGRKNIAFLGVLLDDESVGKQRYQGFKDAINKSKLSIINGNLDTINKNLDTINDNYEIADFSIESGYKSTKKLFEKNPNIDGIVCATDSIAIGAMLYLKEQNKQIPEDVFVAGFGGSNLSKVPTPTLTTVKFDYEESGRIAATVIIEEQSKKSEISKSIMLGYKIIENKSTEI